MNYRDIIGRLPAAGRWWAGKSRMAQVGYLGAGAYLGALGVSRGLRAVGRRRWSRPPPGRYEAGAPGLEMHRRRVGHHRMGGGRSEDHLRNLYGGR